MMLYKNKNLLKNIIIIVKVTDLIYKKYKGYLFSFQFVS